MGGIVRSLTQAEIIDSDESIQKAYSINPDARQAAQEIYAALAVTDSALVMFFCCVEYDLQALSAELSRLFKDTPLVGCTTAGEISAAGYVENSITAFSLPSCHFQVETRLIKNLRDFSEQSVANLVDEMMRDLQARELAPLMQNSFALTLLDGMSIREEIVMNTLNRSLKDIQLVGGSAGDNLHFKDTHVYLKNEFHSNAAALILVNTNRPFQVFSDHHLAQGQEKLVVTNADPLKRVVHEFNAEPAALEYCRISGLQLEELDAKAFALNPLAVQIGDHSYIRSIQQVNDDLSLTFFCAIDQGIVLTRMYSTGLVSHTHNLLRGMADELGEPSLVIGYDCIHRRIEMEEHLLLPAISELYKKYNVIGFSTYGEQYNDLHLNHTFTGVALL
jgi:hypothetical protein